MTQPAYANEPSPEIKISTSGIQTSQNVSQVKQKAYTQDERCELLSAYIDGECSYPERQLVERWLASDMQMQQQYRSQLKLQLAIKTFFQGK